MGNDPKDEDSDITVELPMRHPGTGIFNEEGKEIIVKAYLFYGRFWKL